MKKIAIVGGGLAGLIACDFLSEYFEVDVYEKDARLGGRLKAFTQEVEINGKKRIIEGDHGYHGFFINYYNYYDYMKKRGIENYLQHPKTYPFYSSNIKVQNLDFVCGGIPYFIFYMILSIRTILLKFKFNEILIYVSYIFNNFFVLIYDIIKISIKFFRMLMINDDLLDKYDSVNILDYFDNISDPFLKKNVIDGVRSATRNFFSDPKQMSITAMMKFLHEYGFSSQMWNKKPFQLIGVSNTLEKSVTNQIIKYIKHGTVYNNTIVDKIFKQNNKFIVNNKIYDYCIVAVNQLAAVDLMLKSPDLNIKVPSTLIIKQENIVQYYCVRIFLDKKVNVASENDVIGIGTSLNDEIKYLTYVHFYFKNDANYTEMTFENIYVYELQGLYFEGYRTIDEMYNILVSEFFIIFPEVKDAKILTHIVSSNYSNATQYNINQNKDKFKTISTCENLYFAGDWINTGMYTFLMENACLSAKLAVNEIFKKEHKKPLEIIQHTKEGYFSFIYKYFNFFDL